MTRLQTITVAHPDDRDYILRFLERYSLDQNLEIRESGNAFLLYADIDSLSPASRTRAKNLARALRDQCFYISFYDVGKLNQSFPGSARAESWQTNMPHTAPNAPDYHWNQRAIRFPEAKGLLTASKGPLNLDDGWRTTGIQVVQFDSGYSEHPALVNSPGYNPNGYDVFFVDGEDSAKDKYRAYDLASNGYQKPAHGTATGGTMMAVGGLEPNEWPSEPLPLPINNVFATNLTSGLFPYVEFIPVKISETVTLGTHLPRAIFPNVGDARNLIKGLDFAMDQQVDIITMSMGGSFNRRDIKQAYRKAYKQGIIMTCAAGNSKMADFFVGVVSPAVLAHTIAVAAVEPVAQGDSWKLEPWNQSCDGMQVDISAPGRYVYAAIGFDPRRFNNQELEQAISDGVAYKFGGATSQATVHAASTAALWKYYYKDTLNTQPFRDDPWKIVEAFRFALFASRYVPSHWTGVNKREYFGVLNAERMLDPLFAPDSDDCKEYLDEVADIVDHWRHKDKIRRQIFNTVFSSRHFSAAFYDRVAEANKDEVRF